MDKQLKELQELYASPEYRRASQLAKVDSKKLMGDRDRHTERRAWNRAAELEATMKAEEPQRQDRDGRGNIKSPGGLMKGRAKFILPEVFRIKKLPAHEPGPRILSIACALAQRPEERLQRRAPSR